MPHLDRLLVAGFPGGREVEVTRIARAIDACAEAIMYAAIPGTDMDGAILTNEVLRVGAVALRSFSQWDDADCRVAEVEEAAAAADLLREGEDDDGVKPDDDENDPKASATMDAEPIDKPESEPASDELCDDDEPNMTALGSSQIVVGAVDNTVARLAQPGIAGGKRGL